MGFGGLANGCETIPGLGPADKGTMLVEYIKKAMRLAQAEKMEDGRYFAKIPGFKGLWADGDNRKECLGELRLSLEEWLVIALRADEDLPELSGTSLNFGGKRWQTPAPAEN